MVYVFVSSNSASRTNTCKIYAFEARRISINLATSKTTYSDNKATTEKCTIHIASNTTAESYLALPLSPQDAPIKNGQAIEAFHSKKHYTPRNLAEAYDSPAKAIPRNRRFECKIGTYSANDNISSMRLTSFDELFGHTAYNVTEHAKSRVVLRRCVRIRDWVSCVLLCLTIAMTVCSIGLLSYVQPMLNQAIELNTFLTCWASLTLFMITVINCRESSIRLWPGKLTIDFATKTLTSRYRLTTRIYSFKSVRNVAQNGIFSFRTDFSDRADAALCVHDFDGNASMLMGPLTTKPKKHFSDGDRTVELCQHLLLMAQYPESYRHYVLDQPPNG